MKFFYLQSADRRTILTLIVVIVAALAVLYVADKEKQPSALQEAADEKQDSTRRQHKSEYYYQGEAPKPRLFPFDPNTADSIQLLSLGLKPWQVRNIYKYRAAGGIYRHPRDFAKLYGLTVGQYRRLEPYIRIGEEYQPASRYYAKEPAEERDTVKYPVKLQAEERIELNKADTTLLRKVPGIGSYFARRVVEYRERLGGYSHVRQLLEIENFPESAVAFFIIPDNNQLRKVNVNRLSLNELKRHPYISFFQARAICDYRRLHGRLESLQQLSTLKDFPPESIERLEPYVEY